MFHPWQKVADWLVYHALHLLPGSKIGSARAVGAVLFSVIIGLVVVLSTIAGFIFGKL
jgi:hypothetical protein